MLKKIETKHKKEAKEKKKTILGLVIAIILVTSTIGFILMQGYTTPGEKQIYNDYEFIRQGNYWITQADSQTIETLYLPQEIINITESSPSISRQFFSNKIIYFIAMTGEEKQSSYELSQYLPALRMQRACLPGDTSDECNNLPEKTCQDAVED